MIQLSQPKRKHFHSNNNNNDDDNINKIDFRIRIECCSILCCVKKVETKERPFFWSDWKDEDDDFKHFHLPNIVWDNRIMGHPCGSTVAFATLLLSYARRIGKSKNFSTYQIQENTEWSIWKIPDNISSRASLFEKWSAGVSFVLLALSVLDCLFLSNLLRLVCIWVRFYYYKQGHLLIETKRIEPHRLSIYTHTSTHIYIWIRFGNCDIYLVCVCVCVFQSFRFLLLCFNMNFLLRL